MAGNQVGVGASNRSIGPTEAMTPPSQAGTDANPADQPNSAASSMRTVAAKPANQISERQGLSPSA